MAIRRFRVKKHRHSEKVKRKCATSIVEHVNTANKTEKNDVRVAYTVAPRLRIMYISPGDRSPNKCYLDISMPLGLEQLRNQHANAGIKHKGGSAAGNSLDNKYMGNAMKIETAGCMGRW